MLKEFEPNGIDDPELIAELYQAVLEHAREVARQNEQRVRSVTGGSDAETCLTNPAVQFD